MRSQIKDMDEELQRTMKSGEDLKLTINDKKVSKHLFFFSSSSTSFISSLPLSLPSPLSFFFDGKKAALGYLDHVSQTIEGTAGRKGKS